MSLFAVIQDDAAWADLDSAHRCLDALMNNPFVAPDRMMLDQSRKWTDPDPATALKSFSRTGKKTAAVALRRKRPAIYATMTKTPVRNTLQVGLDDDLAFDAPAAVWADYLDMLCTAMPGFDTAYAGAEYDIEAYHSANGIDPIPLCFRESLRWMHVITPQSYGGLFSREDLLALPAEDITDLGDGTLRIRFYAHPRDFRDPAVAARLAEASKHLTAVRRDRA